MTIRTLQAQLADFAKERDWEQFHTPENLVMALAGEAGELLEVFQWLTPEESDDVMREPDRARAVREEMADVFVYLLRLADVLGIDVAQALKDKIETNRHRYPAHLARGRADKYTVLREHR
ncbi:nucleotide pyrophosphohydrolase [Streptomyces sp. NPDC008001]|uniref:nucleotide pyrophosphohydrolase n=1 Tax=Streptomyces sp. NPDC008001 TaxID=3364804 RepID=UPI0036E8BC2D